MEVRVLGFRVGFQIGGFGGPFWALPHDESFVQGVEAVTAEAGGADGQRFLVALGVREVQGQGVRDPTLLLQGLDHCVDETVGHGGIRVRED